MVYCKAKYQNRTKYNIFFFYTGHLIAKKN